MTEPQQRTTLQNKSLHLWATLMADSMNDAGFDQRIVIEQFKDGFELPWTMYAVKDLFRTVARAMYGAESTADLTTTELQRVYEVVDARLSEITGIHHEWPSLESQSNDAIVE